MAIRSLPKVSCSLNLGLIYNLSYNYDPNSGSQISVFFVNETGQYDTNVLSYANKATIKIGNAIFAMYPVRYSYEMSVGRKVIRVDFIDDAARLNDYYITLPYRGGGTNIITLGRAINTITPPPTQGRNPNLDKVREVIEFPDYEYSFPELVTALKREGFDIQWGGQTKYDSLTQPIVGTAREALDAWCSLLNLTYFFEGSTIKIVDPTSFEVQFPDPPSDALSFSVSEDISNTFSKTACLYYKQEGGEIPVIAPDNSPLGRGQNAQGGDSTGDTEGEPAPEDTDEEPAPEGSAAQEGQSQTQTLVRYVTCYPIEYEFGLETNKVDLDQVSAAQYGQEFWLLYNYLKGSAQEECGWIPTYKGNLPKDNSLAQSISVALGSQDGGLVFLDTDKFNEKYNLYRTYGQRMAGRYYLSNRVASNFYNRQFNWYDNTRGEYFIVTDQTPTLNVQFLSNSFNQNEVIEGTQIGKYFPGFTTNGERILYIDDFVLDIESIFSMPDSDRLKIKKWFAELTEGYGASRNMDYSSMGLQGQYIVFKRPSIDIDLISMAMNKIDYFKPKFQAFHIKGVKSDLVSQTADTGPNLNETLKAKAEARQQEMRDTIEEGKKRLADAMAKTKQAASDLKTKINDALFPNDGPIPETVTDGILTRVRAPSGDQQKAYYQKYYAEKSSSSNGGLRRKFDLKEISVDVPVIFKLSLFGKSYTVTRDFTYLNQYLNNNLLSIISEAWLTPEKTITFTLNYFYEDIPLNFLSGGLVGLNLSIDDQGITASYTYSNNFLRPKSAEAEFAVIQQNIRSSYIRTREREQIIAS